MSHPLQKLDIFADWFVLTLPPLFPHLFQNGSLSVEVLNFHERLCAEGLGEMTPSGSYWMIKSRSIARILQKHKFIKSL